MNFKKKPGQTHNRKIVGLTKWGLPKRVRLDEENAPKAIVGAVEGVAEPYHPKRHNSRWCKKLKAPHKYKMEGKWVIRWGLVSDKYNMEKCVGCGKKRLVTQ